MSELQLVTYPHPSLKSPAKLVSVFDSELEQTIKAMIDLMYKEDGIGLAAPQVGLSKRLFVIDVSNSLNEPQWFINPKIVDKQGECESREGCLSLPGIYIDVKRAEKITVEYQDEKGHPVSLTAEGLTARAIQHEYDHLEGIVLLEHLSQLKKMMAIKKLKKYQQTEG